MDTLWDLEMSAPSSHFVPTLTPIGPGHDGWRGATAPINAQIPSKHINNLKEPICYVAGPPGMVAGLIKPWLISLSSKRTFAPSILQAIESRATAWSQ